ncbi:MAG: hypothetical protein Kow0029_01170 [Candidatus Rifleibacteriota bacterium]
MRKFSCVPKNLFILVVLVTTLVFSTSVSFAAKNDDQAAASTVRAATSSSGAETKSENVKNVQSSIDKKVQGYIDDPKNRLIQEAILALQETENALKALEEGKKDEAIACLERIVGKLQLAVARNPKLALFPVSKETIIHDLYANTDTVKAAIKEARNKLNDGAVQDARHILSSLASEIIVRVTKLPIATFPKAIMAVAPLIDADKIDEAKDLLRQTLQTLVIEEYIIPLAPSRAKFMLKEAEKLAEKSNRSASESQQLTSLLDSVENELRLAQLLGYKIEETKAYDKIAKELNKIRQKTEGGKSGKGFFTAIQEMLSNLWP